MLRGARRSDIADRQALGRDPEITRMFGGEAPARPALTDTEAQGWYDRIVADPNPYHWVIELKGHFIGTARLHSLDEHDGRARFGIGILDRTLLGCGIGTEVTRLVLRYAFEDLALHRVDLRVLAYNERAIASYRKCGFVEEGRERESAFVDGGYHDDVMMGILAQEYAAASQTWRST